MTLNNCYQGVGSTKMPYQNHFLACFKYLSFFCKEPSHTYQYVSAFCLTFYTVSCSLIQVRSAHFLSSKCSQSFINFFRFSERVSFFLLGDYLQGIIGLHGFQNFQMNIFVGNCVNICRNPLLHEVQYNICTVAFLPHILWIQVK